MRAQAPKRGTRSFYASRRRLRGSLPVVRDDGPVRGNGEDARRVAVGADGTRRGINLTGGAGCLYSSSGLEEVFSETKLPVLPIRFRAFWGGSVWWAKGASRAHRESV
jgi:hypothetical protein